MLSSDTSGLASTIRPLLWPLALMAVLWTIVPALVHTAPPLDVVESALWGREWVVGTYKHPGMPSWFIEIGRWLNGGRIGWPVYATAQLFNLATLALTFVFARDLAGTRVATAAVLALLGVEYFSWRTIEFNHTQAQMPFWVGSAWCAWRAQQSFDLRWWLALGAFAALGLYAKLSNAMLLLVIAGWIVSTPRGRQAIATPGPWLGALLFVGLCAPLMRWLIASNFAALVYADARGHEQSLAAMLLFPANALLQAAPVALVLALANYFARPSPATPLASARQSDPINPEAWRALWVLALLPPLVSVGLAVVSGSGLRASWMAPALPLLTVLVLVHFRDRLTDAMLVHLNRICLALAAALPIMYGLYVLNAGRLSSATLLRVNWPQAEVARALSAAWTAETGKPLRIIAGSSWTAGLVGLNHPDRPSILTEGRMEFSPWITPARLQRDGALAVWADGRGAIAMPELEKLIAGRPVKELSIAAPRGRPGQTIIMKYAILPPQ